MSACIPTAHLRQSAAPALWQPVRRETRRQHAGSETGAPTSRHWRPAMGNRVSSRSFVIGSLVKAERHWELVLGTFTRITANSSGQEFIRVNSRNSRKTAEHN